MAIWKGFGFDTVMLGSGACTKRSYWLAEHVPTSLSLILKS